MHGSAPLTAAARLSRIAAAAGLLASAALAYGCGGRCWITLQTNGGPQKCIVDSCPRNAAFNDAIHACACKPNFVPMGGACQDLAAANLACGVGNRYDRGHCVAKTCRRGEVLNSGTGECEKKAAVYATVAAKADITLKAGEELSCASGFTMIVNGGEGSCVPNESLCPQGTKYDGAACVAQKTCAAGEVLDAAGNCAKLATTSDAAKFSVDLKLRSTLSASFCSPLSKSPQTFGVSPGASITLKIHVSVSAPGNKIEDAVTQALQVTTAGGSALAESSAGYALVKKQVEDSVVGSIRAIGGESLEAEASGDITCKISRAPLQVVESHGGGI